MVNYFRSFCFSLVNCMLDGDENFDIQTCNCSIGIIIVTQAYYIAIICLLLPIRYWLVLVGTKRYRDIILSVSHFIVSFANNLYQIYWRKKNFKHFLIMPRWAEKPFFGAFFCHFLAWFFAPHTMPVATYGRGEALPPHAIKKKKKIGKNGKQRKLQMHNNDYFLCNYSLFL